MLIILKKPKYKEIDLIAKFQIMKSKFLYKKVLQTKQRKRQKSESQKLFEIRIKF